MSQVDAILDQVAQLTPDERAELQIRLLDTGPADDGVQEAWGNEIARRLDAYRRGETTAVPASEALARADALLAKLRA